MAEMTNLGMPVPPGFTITTEVCVEYLKDEKLPPGLKEDVDASLKVVEGQMERRFGDKKAPLLLSVRSGGRKSMPGMMVSRLVLERSGVNQKKDRSVPTISIGNAERSWLPVGQPWWGELVP